MRLSGIEDIANLLLALRNSKPVGTKQAQRFIDTQPSLKTRFSRPYNYQRALYKDPKVIGNQFRLLRNIMAKYGITDNNLYNFNKTSFIIGQITSTLVITHSNRHRKAKSIQPRNRKQATAIKYINTKGWYILPFIIIQGTYHLTNQTTESGFPANQVIKPTLNKQTDNKTGLKQIQHFNKHTIKQTIGKYQILILDRHKSYISAEFK